MKFSKIKFSDIKSQVDACQILIRKVRPGCALEDIADAMNFINNEHKPQKGDWYPLFLWDNAGGFGFSDSARANWFAYTHAGARLDFRFETQAEAEYFGKEFEPLHKESFFAHSIEGKKNDLDAKLDKAVSEVKGTQENIGNMLKSISYLQTVDAAKLFLDLIGTLARKENVNAQKQLRQISLISKTGLDIIQSLLEDTNPSA